MIEPDFKVDEKRTPTDNATDSQEFAFSAFSCWNPPQPSGWSLEVVYTYAKVDTETLAITCNQVTAAATESNLGNMIRLTESSFMKITRASTHIREIVDVKCSERETLNDFGTSKNGNEVSRIGALRLASFIHQLREDERKRSTEQEGSRKRTPLATYLQQLYSLSLSALQDRCRSRSRR